MVKQILEWESALDTYARILHGNIQEIFLDLACFFNGAKLSDVMNILLSGCDFAPDYAVQLMIDKSLANKK
jgi:hypothetical protein